MEATMTETYDTEVLAAQRAALALTGQLSALRAKVAEAERAIPMLRDKRTRLTVAHDVDNADNSDAIEHNRLALAAAAEAIERSGPAITELQARHAKSLELLARARHAESVLALAAADADAARLFTAYGETAQALVAAGGELARLGVRYESASRATAPFARQRGLPVPAENFRWYPFEVGKQPLFAVDGATRFADWLATETALRASGARALDIRR